MSPSRWTVWAIAVLLLAGPVAAQRPGTIEVGGFGQWTWFDDNAGHRYASPENGLGYGGRLGVFFTPRWQIEGDGYYSPQSRLITEEFCCSGLFPTDVNASAFALRLNYNVPLAMGGRSHLVLGAGAVRTNYKFLRDVAADTSTNEFGASGLAGLRLGLAKHIALRFDGVVDYMPNQEPDANMNLHARAGISFLFGGSEPAVVAVLPPPAPPLAAPAPEPVAPAPVENAITVCVIDPTQPSGIRMQQALYRVQQRDTVVMQGNNRVPLGQVSGNARTAHDAGWYTGGEPLSMTVGTQSLRYMTYQGARQIDPNGISYLGNINGYPVYAERDHVASVITALNEARAANPNRDLGVILADRRDLHDAIADVEVLYVPLQRTDCIFQPMRIMEQVTKSKAAVKR